MPSCNWREVFTYRKSNCCDSFIPPPRLGAVKIQGQLTHWSTPPPHQDGDADSPSEKICCLPVIHICLVSPSEHPGPAGTDKPSTWTDTTQNIGSCGGKCVKVANHFTTWWNHCSGNLLLRVKMTRVIYCVHIWASTPYRGTWGLQRCWVAAMWTHYSFNY